MPQYRSVLPIGCFNAHAYYFFFLFFFQTNYSSDLKAERGLIDAHYFRAKSCTVMSIIFGLIIIIVIGIIISTDPEKLDNPIFLRLIRLYRP